MGILWVILVVALAVHDSIAMQNVELEFYEGGKYYKEKIVFDESANTAEYDVPKHGSLNEAKYLFDYKNDIKVIKMEETKSCYLMKIGQNGSAKAVETGIKKLKGKFPRDRYIVENHDIVPVYRLSQLMLSSSVQKFCGIYPIYEARRSTIKEVEKLGKKLLANGKQKRGSTKNIIFCGRRNSFTCSGEKPIPGLKCRIRTRSCVYNVQCSPNPIRRGPSDPAWICNGRKVHVYNNMICCDPICLPLSG